MIALASAGDFAWSLLFIVGGAAGALIPVMLPSRARLGSRRARRPRPLLSRAGAAKHSRGAR